MEDEDNKGMGSLREVLPSSLHKPGQVAPWSLLILATRRHSVDLFLGSWMQVQRWWHCVCGRPREPARAACFMKRFVGKIQ